MNFWSLSILCLVTLLVVDSPDSEILWNVNLCLSLIFHSARMLGRPTEAGNPKSKFLMQVSPNLSQLRRLQTASSRIWTRVIVSISNDENNYSHTHAHTHTNRLFFSFSSSSFFLSLFNLLHLLETGVQSQVVSYKTTQKIILDAALLTTQHYKVTIKAKVEQSRGRSCTLPHTLV